MKLCCRNNTINGKGRGISKSSYRNFFQGLQQSFRARAGAIPWFLHGSQHHILLHLASRHTGINCCSLTSIFPEQPGWQLSLGEIIAGKLFKFLWFLATGRELLASQNILKIPDV